MRKLQAELSFDYSSYRVSRAIERLSAETTDFTMQPIPRLRSRRMKVTCLECSHTFSTSSSVPSCPGCGGSDIELA